MRLQTALKYSQYFMYKGEKYYTPRRYKPTQNKAFKLFAFKVKDIRNSGELEKFSSFCYVKPVIRIAGVIDKT